MAKMDKVSTIEEYMSHVPEEQRARVNQLRSVIKEAAPEANEHISYNMPAYDYKGRLVYFAIWQKHIGLYALTNPVIDEFKKELEGRLEEKGTVQLPLDEELPVGLIKKLVKAQVAYNEKHNS